MVCWKIDLFWIRGSVIDPDPDSNMQITLDPTRSGSTTMHSGFRSISPNFAGTVHTQKNVFQDFVLIEP
jgi:hypothetical protein